MQKKCLWYIFIHWNIVFCPLWAAGFSFSKCHAEISVPYDINLIQLWTGEEYSRGARLWTHGYDFYTPTVPIIAHDYSPGKDQKNWGAKREEYVVSEKRLKSILKIKNSDQSKEYLNTIQPKYKLGNKRTLQQYRKYLFFFFFVFFLISDTTCWCSRYNVKI